MPTLQELIAEQEGYRALGNDPWTNLMRGQRDEPLYQPLFNRPPLVNDPNSPIAHMTANPLTGITQADIENATNMAMAFSGGGLATRAAKAKPALNQVAPFPQYAEAYAPSGPPVLVNKTTNKPIARPGGGAWSYDDVLPTGETLHPFARSMVENKPGFVSKKETPELAAEAYWSKNPTPEQAAFAKARDKIQKQMNKEGFTPYFDPKKRADVDPAEYPTTFDPLTGVGGRTNPKSAKSQAEWGAGGAKSVDTPLARERLLAAYEHGLTLPEADRWYFMKQLQDEYKREYGKKAGIEKFKSGFADPMAATTGGATPTANYLMAHYSSFLQNQGLPIPPTHQLATPIGGRYAAGNMDMFGKTLRDPNFTDFGLQNPKRGSFSYNFMGRKQFPTIDEQMSDIIKSGMTEPQWFGPAATLVSDVAKGRGVDARNFQEVAWAGHKAMTARADAMAKIQAKIDKAKTPEEVMALQQQAKDWKFEYEGPMIEHVNASIERTHRLTGMPKDEIVRRGVVRREIPMYGAAGAVGLGAASQGNWVPVEHDPFQERL